ncbi:MAG: ABC transporter ATP-binding protein/permease [Oscillospiraceae bacterium]|nr:ABC transporter ATP-binding protein/permease [Oscillospiraceae bacterium]
MLETKDLCKQYKPKKGVPVQAVDHVSLRFPERGMVFLLGKSGSGKSTMLNLLGGLDQYDSGEIIIKGVSSKDFSQRHFDSYRNTYVGFIFQEYNVLEEFSVGANIALALELQGKKATDQELNEILNAVDLAGFGNRKPNELSGGQKQRVAIARALVKNPQIIMADEPTGALDSATGRQVLDTLKKLSAEKLVIIVSHDREYAEQYADRIIELADGRVIRDVEAVRDKEDETEKHLVFRAASVEIPADYHLTEEDRIQINEYLDRLKTGASLMLPGRSQRFSETDESRIPQQDGSGFNLIRSRLPLKSAFKIGCSSLKHKRFRLVMTILLSVAAFTLFTLVDTFSSYDHIQACTDSLIDSNVNFISLNKAEKRGSGIDEWWVTDGLRISEQDMKQIREDTGVSVTGLFIPHGANFSLRGYYDGNYEFSEGSYTPNMTHFCGFAEITEQSMQDMHFKLVAGTLPDGNKNEIAVSSALCDTFVRAGYSAASDSESSGKQKYEKIASPADMVGKTFRLMEQDYLVSAVIDTGMDLSRYESLREKDEKLTNGEQLVAFMLQNEFLIASNYSLSGCAMVGPGKLQQMIADDPKVFFPDSELNFSLLRDDGETIIWGNQSYFTTADRIPESEIIWLGDAKKTLNEHEIILSLDELELGDAQQQAQLEEYLLGTKEADSEGIKALLKNTADKWTLSASKWNDSHDNMQNYDYPDLNIAGIIRPGSKYSSTIAVCEEYLSVLVRDTEGIYDSAVGAMPENRSGIEKVVRYCYRDGNDIKTRYHLNDPVIFELDIVNVALKALAKVFLYIGIGFAVFASLLLANFISTSIHYKRQEIGILRAIGSRSYDVFRIFFSEGFVIAMINFIVSGVLTFGLVSLINSLLRSRAGILITVLHFGIRQVLLLFAICIGVTALSCFLPVRRIAAKKPIDAIRDK